MAAYQQRYFQVLDYIDAHLNEALSIERLSGTANLSPYHFHRQFSALFGLGVAHYVKLLRLKRAAYQLVFRPETKIIDIAVANGYESVEAFSRAFKQHSGQSPSDFKRNPDWTSWRAEQQPITALRMRKMQKGKTRPEIHIVDFPEIKLAVMEHRGPPASLGESLRRFIQWRKANQLSPALSRTFNLIYHDPETTEPEDYRFDLCAAVKADIPANDHGVKMAAIAAGRCAHIRYTGSDDTLSPLVNYLYADWLEQSNEELRDFPLFFERIKFFPDVPEHEAVTNIYLPIK